MASRNRKRTADKIRYAVVGLGYISQVAVLPAFAHARENSELTALVSSDPKKLQTLSRKYKVREAVAKPPELVKAAAPGAANNRPCCNSFKIVQGEHMARYGKAAGKSVKSAMHREKKGTLKSGKGGKGGRVKSRKQAIAIGLSEARKKGAKVPSKKR